MSFYVLNSCFLSLSPQDVIGSTSFPVNPHIKHGQLDNFLQVPPIPQYCLHFPNHVQCSCILEFDGASKGNHGQAGAGAVLRASNGNMNVHMEFLEGGCPLWLTNNKKG
ncbi:hypothetical protein ACS0TY_005994 [Phlomoides rotata]